MDYYLLTDMAAQIGYELAAAGAETFRIEETMRRVLAAYGIECETFAIPNCVMVSLEADNGKPLMVMKRVGFHGNDLDAVERLNALSRRICAETPDLAVAAQWLEETRNPPHLPHSRLLPRQFSCRGGLLPRLWRNPARQPVGGPDGAYHRLCHAPDG